MAHTLRKASHKDPVWSQFLCSVWSTEPSSDICSSYNLVWEIILAEQSAGQAFRNAKIHPPPLCTVVVDLGIRVASGYNKTKLCPTRTLQSWIFSIIAYFGRVMLIRDNDTKLMEAKVVSVLFLFYKTLFISCFPLGVFLYCSFILWDLIIFQED